MMAAAVNTCEGRSLCIRASNEEVLVDFGSIQIKNLLLNDDAEEVIGTRSSQVIYCLLT